MKHHLPERRSGFFNLFDALAEKGCAPCRLLAKAEHDTLDALLYENVNDPGTREAMSVSLGFCAAHAERNVAGDSTSCTWLPRGLAVPSARTG
jgi:hypothetical protein